MSERTSAILVRLTDKEHKHLKKQAAICGLKMGPFVHKLIMEKEVWAMPPNAYYDLIRAVNAVGNNINQIVHIANAEQNISAKRIDEAVKMVDDIMDMVRRFQLGNHNDMDGEIQVRHKP